MRLFHWTVFVQGGLAIMHARTDMHAHTHIHTSIPHPALTTVCCPL